MCGQVNVCEVVEVLVGLGGIIERGVVVAGCATECETEAEVWVGVGHALINDDVEDGEGAVWAILQPVRKHRRGAIHLTLVYAGSGAYSTVREVLGDVVDHALSVRGPPRIILMKLAHRLDTPLNVISDNLCNPVGVLILRRLQILGLPGPRVIPTGLLMLAADVR